MLKTLILTLTMLIITMSAATLAAQQQSSQVLQFSKTPMESSQSQATLELEKKSYSSSSSQSQSSSSWIDFSSSLYEESSTTQGSISAAGSVSPRFVMEEPLTDPSSEEASSNTLDPSAHAKVSEEETTSVEYQFIPPSEKEKLNAAEPYVKELFALTESSSKELKKIADAATADYLAMSSTVKLAGAAVLAEKYLASVLELEKKSDSQAELILQRMTAALVAIGADDTIVQDARAAYERSKKELIEEYTQVFTSLYSQ